MASAKNRYDSLMFTQLRNQATLKQFFKNYKKDGADRKTKSYFEKRLSTLEEHYSKIKAVDADLQKVLYEDEDTLEKEAYFDKNEFAVLESLYLEYYDYIQEEYLTKFPIVTGDPNLLQASPSHAPNQSGVLTTNYSDFKIQKVQIPSFKGDYDSWLTFRDLFNASVNEAPMSNATKLWTLKSLLTGTAADLLADYTVSDGDYPSAWKVLNDRFNNTRVLVNNELQSFMSIPSIRSENANEVKRLYDKCNKLMSRLKHLKIDTSHWDAILVFIVSQKLPKETHQSWEQTLTVKTAIPLFSDLQDFLLDRFRTLEAVSKPSYSSNSSSPNAKSNAKAFHTKSRISCSQCSQEHFLRQCPQFLAQSVDSRFQFIKAKKGCINCLSTNHTVGNCNSRFTCQKCQKKHHTMLHKNNSQINSNPAKPGKNANATGSTKKPSDNPSTEPNLPGTSFHSHNTKFSSHVTNVQRKVLLATALVVIQHNNQLLTVRALIDPGSEISLILESVQRKLKLPTTSVNAVISGMGGMQTASSTKKTYCTLKSRNHTESLELEVLVLKQLTGFLPSKNINKIELSQFGNLQLADKRFYKSQKVEVVLGADIYPQILKEGTLKFGNGQLIAQETIFGWVISGICENSSSVQCNLSSTLHSFHTSLDDQIRKFWEAEKIPSPQFLSSEDEYCEEIYKSSTIRNSDGRYVVKLPFREDYPEEQYLSHSRYIALRRFQHLEAKLNRDPELKQCYDQVIQDYVKLGHMSPAAYSEPTYCRKTDKIAHCYLPHHGVIKPSSTTTKLRVVYDASCKSLNGNSLNSVLLVGPTLQQDIMSIILRWRKYPYVFNADIEKMYRQIWIHPEHAHYQRILYRSNTDLQVQDFQLNTVTFGVSSAPYLAIRTLLQLAEDEKNEFPIASKIVQTDFYVDDVLSGTYSLGTAITAQHELRSMLKNGGFELKKWSANKTEILRGIPIEDRMPDSVLNLEASSTQKTLGVYWNKKEDYFSFKINLKPVPDQITKRQLFSEIAKLFDPAGWLGPIVINAKILMQQVWADETDWDHNVQLERLKTWKILISDLPNVEKIRIHRYLKYHPENYTEIHGFCDASQLAYGAVLYMKTTDIHGNVNVRLIMAKTKVAPKSQDQLTIPRLELCGAVLLCKLLSNISSILDIPLTKLFAWCDSTVVLAWLKGSPAKWKTFVANRVAFITKNSGFIQWKYVSSSDNPADIASRGVMPSELLSSSMWWQGPSWLSLSSELWPTLEEQKLEETKLEAKAVKVLATSITTNPLNELLGRFSSLPKALRTLSYCRRFLSLKFPSTFTAITISTPYIAYNEMQESLTDFARASQKSHYPSEYQALQSQENISNKSSLLTLNPFIDSKGIIRMNGRLSGLYQGFSEQFPIILAPHSDLVKLIIRETHLVTLHGGVQAMTAYIRKQFWVPKLKLLLKTHINHCKTCIVHKKKTMSQLMGALPNERASISLPFANTGIDYAGPITLKLFKGRCAKFSKGYIALFICFSTKAVHLEAVSDLSTKTFLSALDRFFARRGLCQNIYSDNGTNFVGANNELTKQFRMAIQQASAEAAPSVASRKVNWHFIPPGAPHFGGLWEAGIKSVKTHLRKIIQKAVLTYEELSTLLCKIEACLNSRPLTALSDDPNDLNPLTPGHFLRGDALLAPPTPGIEYQDLSQIKRLELLRQLKHEFWARWKIEYLSQLQQRPKWKFARRNLVVGDLVVIKNEVTPPQFWKLGRVVDVHQGSDGLVRVATVKTMDGIAKRPISKLCLLPHEKGGDSCSAVPSFA